MSALAEKIALKPHTGTVINATCYHCGATCFNNGIRYDEKSFCCDGCKLVYEILAQNGMCDYYTLQSHPGLKQIKALRKDKFAYLDEPLIADRLYRFTDGNYTVVNFFIPAIHCSSCMWLLEHLHQLKPGIENSRINFSAKEVTIGFRREKISLREVVELLAAIGYEPAISLDCAAAGSNKVAKSRLYKLGVAGFCFGNIMLMSFPEYLSGPAGIEHQYALLFRVLNLILSIPVVVYAASEFFQNAWAGLRQKNLNIDAPIALAIAITFGRSIYEILSGTGGGYLDSMSGIVFFMLVGRLAQERTYRSLTFHRDYKAYFPMAATVIVNNVAVSKPIVELEQHDIVKVFHDELVPADGIVISGTGTIDYSFVSGENDPVQVATGEKVYAGGKQLDGSILIEVLQPVTSSYLTSLWNDRAFAKNKTEENDRSSYVHVLSKYFSIVLFCLAAVTASYWWFVNPAMILPSVSAMLIVACPCALLLTATYTNGNVLRILSDNGLYLRDATVIEQLGDADSLVFDKTGTLTIPGRTFHTEGYKPGKEELQMVYSAAIASNHPKSRQLVQHLAPCDLLQPDKWREVTGKGIEAFYNNHRVLIGSAEWVQARNGKLLHPELYVRIDEKIILFYWQAEVRSGVEGMLAQLNNSYHLSLLSGDNDRHRNIFSPLFKGGTMMFGQQPADKLRYIADLQSGGHKVVMIGDGLNDAGALQQSNAGITLADDINNFSPSCDAILRAEELQQLPAMLQLAGYSKTIIKTSFIISILYNIAGISISMMGKMNPMIAAILMPLSTLTIVLVTTGASTLIASRLGLRRSSITY